MANSNPDEKIIGDRYKVIGVLGRGGVGKVYKCNDLQLDRIVAVKVLFDQTADLVARFHSEAKVSAKLTHESIVNVVDFGITNDSEPFLAMEYLEGESLKNKIKREGSLGSLEILPLAIDIAAGLAHAHEHGILHRDIKPSNIMLVKNSKGDIGVKIVDFGIAKNIANIDQHLTSTGAIIGTPLYLSPEAVEGRTVDVRSEIYSFGCLLYEALSGTAPFESDTTITTMMARLEQEAPVLDDTEDQDYPDEIKSIVSNCLERNPDKRFSDFGELGNALTQALESIAYTDSDEEQEEDEQVELLVTPGSLQEEEKRSKLPLFLATGLILLVVAGFIVTPMLTSRKKNDASQKHISKKAVFEDNILTDTSFKRMKDSEGREWVNLFAFSGKMKMFKKLLGEPNVKYVSAQFDDMSGPESGILNELNLKGISLQECKIDRQTLLSISSCPSLEVVRLSGVTENEPADFQLLNKLEKLQELDLSGTNVRDLDLVALSNLTNLKTLNLYKCQSITGSSLKAVKSSTNLATVSLGRTRLQLEYLRDLSGLPITNINLSKLKVNDKSLTPLLSMPLTILNLEDTTVTDKELIVIAKSLNNLNDLYTQGCKNIDGSFLKHIDKLPRLRILSLRASGIKKNSLKYLSRSKSITNLDLSDLSIRDSDLVPILKLPLIELALENNPVTDKGLMKLAQVRTLKKIHLKKCAGITSNGRKSFNKLMPGCKLYVSQKGLEGNPKEFFEHAINLKH